jgi:DNA-binding transcriptional LysR family regulator
MAYQSGLALEQLATFVAVVDANGFSAAARLTHARKATLSQRVRQLEKRLGVTLLARTTRTLRLTDEGRAYLEHARRALSAAVDADAVVARAKQKPSGVLRVTTSAALASVLLETVITPFLSKHPQVSVHLDTSVRRTNLIREGNELAVRTGPLEESSLLSRKLGTIRCGYYASPACREREPLRPEDVAQCRAIVVGSEGPPEWPFVVKGKPRSIVVRPRVVVDSFDLAIRAAVDGAGIVRSPRHFAEPHLAKGRLRPVLLEWTPPSKDVYAVFPPGATLVPKTRLFIDALAAWFKANPAAI